MKFVFSELVDLDELQSALQAFYPLIGLPVAVFDMNNTLLANVGLTDLCCSFHAAHPVANMRCFRSKKDDLSAIGDKDYVISKCPNGLINMLAPITINGEALAMFALGQFLFSEPDMDFFTAQALELGFELDPYLEAVKGVPVVTEKEASAKMVFCVELAKLLAQVGVKNLHEKEAAMRAKESQELYDLVLHGMTDIIALCDVDKNYNLNLLMANSAFYSFFGVDKGTAVNFQSIIPQELAEKYANMSREVLENKRVIRVEENTDRGHFNVVLTPIIKDDKTCVLAFVQDVTKEKIIDEYRIKNVKLQSIGTIAGGIAHDFNNLLTVLLGNLSMAKVYYQEPEKLFEKFAEIEESALQIKDLSTQLLTFAKGGEPLRKETSIAKVIQDSVKFANSGANVKCETVLDANLSTVEVDVSQMRQVFNNLIINAVQAMPSGGSVRIKAENYAVTKQKKLLSLPEGYYVKLTVEDNGIGIAESHLESIFDPFFTTKANGSGLGLSTAKSIIEKHDGMISVMSKPGLGTTVTVYLPVALGNNGMKTRETNKGKVLVMDDEESIRKLAAEMLCYLSYEVDAASDGNVAIALYKRAKELGMPYDIVICDLTVPGGMGGQETVSKLLQIDPNVRAIVSSGYSSDPILANYKEYGFIDMIPKPYQLDEFAKTVERALQRPLLVRKSSSG